MSKKMKGKSVATAVAALALSCAMCAGCAPIGGKIPGNDEKIDKSKTQLYVSNLNAGIGSDWLDALKTRFEAEYAEEEFEAGKQGVQVVIDKENQVNARWLLMPTDSWEVYFNENLPYNEFVSQKYLLDISDVVKGPAFGESETILSKLDPVMAEGLAGYDGKYYALPHYEAFRGITYNATVFAEKRLFLAANPNNGNDGFIVRKDDPRSPGPDGDPATEWDNGLPATIDEFAKLIAQAKKMGVIPFVWPGATTEYTEYLVNAVAANLSGYDVAQLDYTFNSGEKTARIVTDFNGTEPIISETKITEENGYLLRQTEGKYYGLSVLADIIKDIDKNAYSLSNATSTFTQLDAQEEFYNSYLENKPIAMLIDGNYWWNESKRARSDADAVYKDRATGQEFAYMPLPHKVHADSEAATTKQTITDCLKSYAFVNANIADKPEKVRLAKLFLSYAYTDASLQEFTSVTGVAKGLNYEMTPAQLEALPNYARSCWTVRRNADIVRQVTTSKLYMQNEYQLYYNQYSTVLNNGASYVTPFSGFRAKADVQDYFKGTWISQTNWEKDYGRYWS